jgi:hypothetical protein
MKGLSLVWFVSACAILAQGCSNGAGGTSTTGTGGAGNGAGGGAGGNGGAAGSGAAGKTGTGGGGAGGANGGAIGSVCPGVQPLSGTLCRNPSECPGNGYVCTSDPSGVSSACGGFCISPPPRHDCTVDGDCGTGKICSSYVTPCCGMTSTTCAAACTATSCAAGQRCNAAGHCETFPCGDGFTCPAGTVCSASTAGADANGCAPVLCNAGYTCPTGYQCAAGSAGTDPHGCELQPCSQTGCPINSVCATTATTGECSVKKCTSDSDCDCGFCVGGSCAGRLSVCVIPPS